MSQSFSEVVIDMIVNLDEMKGYLRVDFDDDDALIENFVTTGRISVQI